MDINFNHFYGSVSGPSSPSQSSNFSLNLSATSGTSSHSVQNRRKRKDMTEHQRRDCIDDLLQRASGVSLAKNSISELSEKYGVSRWTIQRLWRSVKYCIRTRQHIKVQKNYRGKVGRKAIQLITEELIFVPLRKRTNIRSLAKAINVNKSTIGRLVKWGHIKRHSNTLKPGLTQTNKLTRLRWCIGQIQTLIQSTPRFKDMYNILHVDEKWVFMSKNAETYYLSPTEADPYKTEKSEHYICKVMFISVVGRPRYNQAGQNIFDGKIGIYPLTERLPVQRSSVHRPRSTIETKPIKKITREVIKQTFIQQILPDIKSKWPADTNGQIFIQQDNATPHLAIDDPEFYAAAHAGDGFEINLISQPPNSPDLNVLDLGFFRAIQSLQHQQAPKTIDELILAVKNALFHLFDVNLLGHVWLSYQYCMLEVLKVGGGNNYKLPHYGKHRMQREGTLPDAIEVSEPVLQQAMSDMISLYLDITSMHDIQAASVGNGQTEADDTQDDTAHTQHNTTVYVAALEGMAMEVDEMTTMMDNLTME